MNKKIKILILINELLLGGAQRIVLDLAKNIDKTKFDINIVYLKSHGIFKDKNKSLEDYFIDQGINVICLEGSNKLSFQEIKSLWHIIKKIKPDILHTFLPYAGILGRIVGKLSRVPYIVSTQCNLPMSYSKRVNFLDKLTLPLVDFWTGATHGIELAYGGSIVELRNNFSLENIKHLTIFGGVDVELIKKSLLAVNKENKKQELGIPCDTSVLMMTARLISWKGHRELIEAVSFLPDNFHLVLVGWGPLEDELRSLVDRLNIKERVHFLGMRKDVYQILAIADFYIQVHSIGDRGAIWQGANLSQIEAGAAGVPSISTAVPLIEYFITDKISGLLTKPNNAKDIYNKLIWASKHKREMMEMAKKLSCQVENRYSLKSMVGQYEFVYDYLVSR